MGSFFHSIVDDIIDTLGSMTYILVQHWSFPCNFIMSKRMWYTLTLMLTVMKASNVSDLIA